MQKIISYLIPVIIIAVMTTVILKKGRPYEDFVNGAGQSFKLVLYIFPYLSTIFIMTELFEQSGLSMAIIDLSAGFFKLFGIDKALIPLVILKPFSGSGSLGILSEIMKKYGADSYLSKCAAAIYGSSETIFYVGAVYYSECKRKPGFLPFLISIISNFIATVFACFICRVI